MHSLRGLKDTSEAANMLLLFSYLLSKGLTSEAGVQKEHIVLTKWTEYCCSSEKQRKYNYSFCSFKTDKAMEKWNRVMFQ